MTAQEWICANVGRLLIGQYRSCIFGCGRLWCHGGFVLICHCAMTWMHGFLELLLLLLTVLDVVDVMMIVVQVIGAGRCCCGGGADGGGVGIFGRGIVASVVVGRMH